MDKKKTGMESIQFWLHHTLKSRLEKYGTARGLTMAESLRCLVVNLPEEDHVNLSDLIVLRDKIQKKIDAYRSSAPPPAAHDDGGEGKGS